MVGCFSMEKNRWRGESKKKEPKKPPSRLQKHAPASLQVGNAEAWDNSCTAIPLLSPIILSPIPLPDADDRGGGVENMKERRQPPPQPGGGWWHPALPMVVMEPASLLPFFQTQCALVHNLQ